MRNKRPSLVIPALETNTSTGPNSASTDLNASSTESIDVTSHLTANNPSGGGEEL